MCERERERELDNSSSNVVDMFWHYSTTLVRSAVVKMCAIIMASTALIAFDTVLYRFLSNKLSTCFFFIATCASGVARHCYKNKHNQSPEKCTKIIGSDSRIKYCSHR